MRTHFGRAGDVSIAALKEVESGKPDSTRTVSPARPEGPYIVEDCQLMACLDQEVIRDARMAEVMTNCCSRHINQCRRRWFVPK